MQQIFTHIHHKHGITWKEKTNKFIVKRAAFIIALILMLTITAAQLSAQVEVHNYPNTFTNNTTIKYDLPSNMHVTVKTTDNSGAEINTLIDTQQVAGSYNITSNGILHNLMVMCEGANLYVLLTKDNGLTDQMITGKMVMRK